MEDPNRSALVIGAGVVGLACARALAADGWSVLVAERAARPGQGTSSRNSGVIHAGLYYPSASLKARSCVRGRRLLYAYADAHGVPHAKSGKLVLAQGPDEEAALHALLENARESGVEGLSLVSRAELARDEPALRASLALRSTESGLVDAHGLMDALKADARERGALFAFAAEVEALVPRQPGWEVCARGQAPVRANLVVNAAGHGADDVATAAGIDVDVPREDGIPWRLHPWRGDYFVLGAGAPRPACALVYPMPSQGGLGVHLTRDLGGQLLAGPDATRGEGLRVEPKKAPACADAIARYLPGVTAAQLRPAYAGVRPKRRADGGFADFVVAELPRGLVHVLGIESPGLTASLALAEEVRRLAREHR